MREKSMKRWLTGIPVVVAVAVAGLAFAPSSANAACGKEGVYVFETSWCPYCKALRAMLARNNVQYTSIDAGNARAKRFMLDHFNTTAIPVTVTEDAHVVGFNEKRIRQLLCL
jgi:glutaredoxin